MYGFLNYYYVIQCMRILVKLVKLFPQFGLNKKTHLQGSSKKSNNDV